MNEKEKRDFLREEKRQAELPPKFARCATHNSTYTSGSQCYFCRTGYKPKDMDRDLMPKRSAVRRVAHEMGNPSRNKSHDPSSAEFHQRNDASGKTRAVLLWLGDKPRNMWYTVNEITMAVDGTEAINRFSGLLGYMAGALTNDEGLKLEPPLLERRKMGEPRVYHYRITPHGLAVSTGEETGITTGDSLVETSE